jgi:TRAP-type C4-dicarboxylate transport system substrate-binding protein
LFHLKDTRRWAKFPLLFAPSNRGTGISNKNFARRLAMRRRHVFVALVMVGFLLTILPSQTLSQAKVIRWKGQNAFTGHPAIAATTFAKWIEKRSGGRLVMNVEPPNTIVPVREMFSAVSKGLLDFAGVYFGGYHGGIMPEVDIETGLPLAWESSEEVWDAFYQRGLLKKIREIYAEKNVFFLATCPPGQISQVMGTFPIKSLKDFKGKKIGGVGIVGEFVKLLGGIPVNVPYVERYMALKMGTVDGVITGASSLDDIKLREVVTHFVVHPNVNSYGNSFIVNLKSWNALPDDIKKFLNEETRYLIADQHSMLDGIEARYAIAKSVRENKLKVVSLPDEEVEWLRNETMTKVWDKVAAKSPRCAELVELVRKQMRDLGKLK